MTGARRIGVFGGTFDPIHLGHLIVAEAAREQASLDQVLLVPAGDPWHRPATGAAAGDRLAMVRLAVADNPALGVSSVDVDREGPTYTVETLAILGREHAPARLVFLIGFDALAQLPTWYQPARIADLAEVVALRRPGAPDPDMAALRDVLPAPVRVLETPLIALSATEIRDRVANGRSIRYRVVPAVGDYIERHGLYRRA